MKKRYVIFKAAGRTVRFAARIGGTAVRQGKAHLKHYQVRQKSLKHKVDRRTPKGASGHMFKAPHGKAWACATCGKRYVNYKAARNHVQRANHSYIQQVRI